MLRALVRRIVFEHMPVATGLASGVAQALLVGWIGLLVRGPAAVAPGALLALAAALAALHAWGVPRAGTARHRGPLVRALAATYIAGCFATIASAAALAGFAVAFAGLGSLLAADALGTRAAHGAFRWGSAATVALAGGALAWGFALGGRSLAVTPVRVALPGLAPGLAGLRIAHLSDLHIGNGVEGRGVDRIVDRTLALAPDLICITGDLFDHDPDAIPDGARRLGRLRAPLGVFAVLGNHDQLTGGEAVAAGLAQHAPAVHLLRGAAVRLPGEAPLYVAGVDDPGHDWTPDGGHLASLAALASTAPDDGPVVLLVHRPDAFPEAAELGFRLVLAGHFHGGQVAVPMLGGRWNAGRLFSPYHRGLYRAGRSTLYVSRGLGFAGPRIRLGSAPEIALLELVPTAA